MVIELRDTVRETQTITITKNENGDTLKVIQTTDRTRARDASRMQDRNEKLTVVRDTVYVERRDSVLVKSEERRVKSSISHHTSAISHLLKCRFWILVAGIVLVVVLRFGRLLK